jgi:uncharacterized membrane protein (DUF485 family)
MSSAIEPGGSPPTTGGSTYLAVQESPEFAELKRSHRSVVFPLALLFLAWYFLYVLLADYAHGFMAREVVGNINVGLVFGLLQFVSTFAITMLYVRYADRKLDPLAERLRERIEGAER